MNRERRWYRVFGAIAFILVGSLLLYPDSRAVLNANQGALSGTLSFLLVLLYFGQYRLQDRQLSLENRPHIELQRYEPEQKEFELWLSNPGNGVAKDIEVVTEINFPETKDIRPATNSYRVRRVDEDGDKKRRVGNSLKAGEHNVRFIGEPHIGLQLSERYQGYGLRAGTGFLAREGIEEINVEFLVKGSDLLGNEYRESIFGVPYTVELDKEGLDLEGILANRVSEWK